MSDLNTNILSALRTKMDLGIRLTPGETAMAQDHGLMNDSNPPKDPKGVQGFGWLIDASLVA